MEDTKESTVHVDPSGNLTLIVGPEDNQKTFTVSSAAMCLASPVWRAMLDPEGHFLEAHSSDRKVSFPDDNPEALLLLLNVIHLQFLRVPQTLPTEELYEVAVLCDKYDTVTVVRPWLQGWILNAKVNKNFWTGAEERWLQIAWVFGDHALFQLITKVLAFHCTVTTPGQLLKANGEPFTGDTNVIASVINTRNVILTNIVTLCKRSIDNLVLGKEQFCDKSMGTSQCNALTLGSFMIGLGNIGLWPLPKRASTQETSVQGLSNDLLHIQFPAFGGSRKKPIHSDCSSFSEKFKVMVKNASNHVPELLDQQQRHLDEQSKK